ncbi:two-component system activity regulator YycH, partial [Staphylococcus aureus]|uniref:two-component system activity regulator YycH n=1 Tax=Staphylococcus aureus TaxID=1280 RepID=UPI0037DA4618
PFLNQHFRFFTTNNHSTHLTYQPFLNPYPTFNKQPSNQIQLTSPQKPLFHYPPSLFPTHLLLNTHHNKTLPKLHSLPSTLPN